MATYTSDNVRLKQGVSAGGSAGSVKVAYAEVTCGAAPSTSDTIEFFYLPAGARVLHATIEATDMDTNVSPTLTINVGDSGDADRIFAASTVGQAGTASTAAAVAGAGYKYSSKTLITGTAANNAATGAAGTIYLWIMYVTD